jgi:hypothetical protein
MREDYAELVDSFLEDTESLLASIESREALNKSIVDFSEHGGEKAWFLPAGAICLPSHYVVSHGKHAI